MSQREVGLAQIFENAQNVRGLLNQIKIEANSRFLQQQTKKIALVWFFLATKGRPRARPLQFCCVPSFNLCTTHSSDNKISILLGHLLKKRLILFLLYFVSNCTPFFTLLRVERRALPSRMPLRFIQQPPWSSMVQTQGQRGDLHQNSHPYKINRDRGIELLAESMDANLELASNDPWAPFQETEN